MEIKPIAMYEDGDSELVKYNLFTALEQLEKYKNIVDELEKWLKYEWYEMSNDVQPNEVLDKLNKLKGAD